MDPIIQAHIQTLSGTIEQHPTSPVGRELLHLITLSPADCENRLNVLKQNMKEVGNVPMATTDLGKLQASASFFEPVEKNKIIVSPKLRKMATSTQETLQDINQNIRNKMLHGTTSVREPLESYEKNRGRYSKEYKLLQKLLKNCSSLGRLGVKLAQQFSSTIQKRYVDYRKAHWDKQTAKAPKSKTPYISMSFQGSLMRFNADAKASVPNLNDVLIDQSELLIFKA